MTKTRSRLRINIVASYIGRTWQILAGFVFLPAYLKVLGAEQYALVAFATVLNATLAFADFGLRPTLTREIAALSAHSGQEQEMHTLSRSVEHIYCMITI